MRPVLLATLGAGALAGVAMAASSVIGDLVAPHVRRPTVLAAAPAVPNGLASQWPDLKDGLPSVAGAAVKHAAVPPEPRAEPVRMASLNPLVGPMASASAPMASAVKVRPEPPAKRIPVPTETATVAPPAASKLVSQTRTAGVLPPRETIRAQDEAPKAEAPKAEQDITKPAQNQQATKPREEAPRPRDVVHKTPVSHPVMAAVPPAPAAEKAKKAVMTQRSTPQVPDGSKPTVVASADPEETDILGVKLPSLAPAGRKLRDGVAALGDAVRNAF